MATTLTLPSTRFTAQVNTGSPELKSNYKALAKRNALALESCPWADAASAAAKPSLVEHDFTASFADEKYDAFLMTGSYDSESGTEIAYAGMAAYRFALPQAYLTGSALLVSASIMLARDRFLLPGLRVAAVLSDSAVPSADWAVVRGDAEGCVRLSAQLANPADRITAATQATGTVEIDLAGLDATKKAYLWVYLTVEDYQATWTWYSSKQYRLYAIEGSGMVMSQATTVTFSADVAPDLRIPTTLKLVNLSTKATDATLTLSGPVYSMVQTAAVINSSYFNTRVAVITGDFDEYSVAGMPGFVVYDYANRQIASVSEASGHEIPASVKAAWRQQGVRARWGAYVNGVEMMFDHVPASAASKVALKFKISDGAFTVEYNGSATVDVTPSAEVVGAYVPTDGRAAMRFCRDRVAICSIDETSGISADKPMLPVSQVAFSGSITGLAANIFGDIIVAGSNDIGGNKSAVKIVTTGGDVIDYFVGLEPDDYDDFVAQEAWGFIDAAAFFIGNAAVGSLNSHAELYDGYTADSSGWHLVTASGKTEPQTILTAVHATLYGFPMLLLTGRFTSIGGMDANGAAILVFVRNSYNDDCQLSLHPLDVGPVRRAVIFCDDTSQLPVRISHMLIEPAD